VTHSKRDVGAMTKKMCHDKKNAQHRCAREPQVAGIHINLISPLKHFATAHHGKLTYNSAKKGNRGEPLRLN